MDVVSCVFVNEEGKVLTQHHIKLDMLTPVSGKVNNGESHYDAIVREIEEETGLVKGEYRLSGHYKIQQSVTGDTEYMYSGVIFDGKPENMEEDKHYWLAFKSREELHSLSETIPFSESMRSALALFTNIK